MATVAWLQSHIQSSKQENVTINASKAAKEVLSDADYITNTLIN